MARLFKNFFTCSRLYKYLPLYINLGNWLKIVELDFGAVQYIFELLQIYLSLQPPRKDRIPSSL